jgi:hypothetical protein
VDFVTPRDLTEDAESSISLIKISIRNFDGKVILEKDIFPPGRKERAWGILGKGVDPDDVANRIFFHFFRRREADRELAQLALEAVELEKEVNVLVARRGW